MPLEDVSAGLAAISGRRGRDDEFRDS